jgi:hypothetical protein
MWRTDEKGAKEFTGGKESWGLAAKVAEACGRFVPDVDEEFVDEGISCYNCRYRRWSAESFTCLGARTG